MDHDAPRFAVKSRTIETPSGETVTIFDLFQKLPDGRLKISDDAAGQTLEEAISHGVRLFGGPR
ncbi:hypothetical protein ASF91_19665 [Rhizobium sp. Leaf155]|nr:hypothetical protein ASF91_19665 [Rhizobium sp. Leaf155]